MKEVTPYIQDSLKAFSDRLDDILSIVYGECLSDNIHKYTNL